MQVIELTNGPRGYLPPRVTMRRQNDDDSQTQFQSTQELFEPSVTCGASPRRTPVLRSCEILVPSNRSTTRSGELSSVRLLFTSSASKTGSNCRSWSGLKAWRPSTLD